MLRKASDLMSRAPEAISTATSLQEAAKIFKKLKFSSLPVIDKKGALAGVLTEVGLIKALVTHHAFWGVEDTVGDHMDLLERAAFVRDLATIDQVMKALLVTSSHRVLVIDDKRKLVGIISPKDVLNILAAEVQESVEANEHLDKAGKKIQAWVTNAGTLVEALDKFKKIIQESPYMMHSVDSSGKVVMANRRTCEMLGYRPDELLGKTIEEIYHTRFHDAAREGLKTLIRRGFHQSVKTQMVKKDGELLHVEIKSRALKSNHNRFLGTVTVVRLLSEDDILPTISEAVAPEEGWG